LEEIVDESFSEQEDNYFQDEPRKYEVVKCYYEVFVNDNNDDSDDNTSDTDESNDNNEESEVKEEEEDD
jgi:hypothetical protein